MATTKEEVCQLANNGSYDEYHAYEEVINKGNIRLNKTKSGYRHK